MSHSPDFVVEVGSLWKLENEHPTIWKITADDGTVLTLEQQDAQPAGSNVDRLDRHSFREQCAGGRWTRVLTAPA